MTSPSSPLESLAQHISGAMPELTPLDRRLAVFLYENLVSGRPVEIEAIARHLEVRPETVTERLARWPGDALALRISPDAVSQVSPPSLAVSIQRPAKAFGADVVPNF